MAFQKLMQAYRKPVYSFLVRHGLGQECRDDAFQEIFLKIHKSAHTYQPNRALSPWIFTIAINTIRNIKRQKQPLTLCIDEAADVIDEAPSPDHLAQLDATLDWLNEAVIQLPATQVEALTLSLVQGMKLKDVSDILGLPLNTIKTHLRRARLQLLDAYQAQQNASSSTGETYEL